MRFSTISITGGQSDTPDPRSAPEDVPDANLIDVPRYLEGTDKPPVKFALTLEGTATQDVDVTFFVLDEQQSPSTKFNLNDSVKEGRDERQFYQLGSAVTVVVGVMSLPSLDVVPGVLYARLTNAPAANAVLKIAFI